MTRTPRLILCLGLSLAVTGCTRMLDMSALNNLISTGIATQMELPIASVTCPAEGREQKAGDKFECTATPETGGLLTVTVTQTDDAGNVSWAVSKTDGLLDLQKVETAVQEGLMAQAQVEAVVECGGRWKGIKPGEVFQCQATAGEHKAAVEVTTTDAEGNISWKME